MLVIPHCRALGIHWGSIGDRLGYSRELGIHWGRLLSVNWGFPGRSTFVELSVVGGSVVRLIVSKADFALKALHFVTRFLVSWSIQFARADSTQFVLVNKL